MEITANKLEHKKGKNKSTTAKTKTKKHTFSCLIYCLVNIDICVCVCVCWGGGGGGRSLTDVRNKLKQRRDEILLAGAATSIIFVTIKRSSTCLSRQNMSFVATKACLSLQNVCRDKKEKEKRKSQQNVCRDNILSHQT